MCSFPQVRILPVFGHVAFRRFTIAPFGFSTPPFSRVQVSTCQVRISKTGLANHIAVFFIRSCESAKKSPKTATKTLVLTPAPRNIALTRNRFSPSAFSPQVHGKISAFVFPPHPCLFFFIPPSPNFARFRPFLQSAALKLLRSFFSTPPFSQVQMGTCQVRIANWFGES